MSLLVPWTWIWTSIHKWSSTFFLIAHKPSQDTRRHLLSHLVPRYWIYGHNISKSWFHCGLLSYSNRCYIPLNNRSSLNQAYVTALALNLNELIEILTWKLWWHLERLETFDIHIKNIFNHRVFLCKIPWFGLLCWLIFSSQHNCSLNTDKFTRGSIVKRCFVRLHISNFEFLHIFYKNQFYDKNNRMML